VHFSSFVRFSTFKALIDDSSILYPSYLIMGCVLDISLVLEVVNYQSTRPHLGSAAAELIFFEASCGQEMIALSKEE